MILFFNIYNDIYCQCWSIKKSCQEFLPILQVLHFKFSFISQKMLWTTVAILSYIQQDITYFILHLRLYSLLCDTVFWSLLLSDQIIFSDFFLYKIFRLIFNLLRSGTGIFGFRDALKWQTWEGTGRRCLCEWGQMFCKGWEAKESTEFLNPRGFNGPCWLQNTNTLMCVLFPGFTSTLQTIQLFTSEYTTYIFRNKRIFWRNYQWKC